VKRLVTISRERKIYQWQALIICAYVKRAVEAYVPTFKHRWETLTALPQRKQFMTLSVLHQEKGRAKNIKLGHHVSQNKKDTNEGIRQNRPDGIQSGGPAKTPWSSEQCPINGRYRPHRPIVWICSSQFPRKFIKGDKKPPPEGNSWLIQEGSGGNCSKFSLNVGEGEER